VLAAPAVGLYLAFVVRVRHAAQPLMNLNLLARRPVAVGTLLVLVATALMITVFFLGSFSFQNHRGYNPLQTGLLFLPVAWPPWPARPSPAESLPGLGPGSSGRQGWGSGGSACGSRPPSTDPPPWWRGSVSPPPGPAWCSSSPVAGFVVVVDAEVEQLYVDRSWRGRGVAERLLRHAEAVIGQRGRRTAWLAVVAGNTRARRFYAKLGWHDRGPFTYPAQTATGTVPVPANRYEREVSDG
jgi:hypothetical protein